MYLSRSNRVIGGVAGGIGEYLDIDPILIRIAFVVATLAGGSGILAYIIAWIVLPEQPKEATMTQPTQPASSPQPQPAPQSAPRPGRGSIVGGLILVVLGLLFLGENFLPDFHFIDYWPLILVAIGAGLIYKSFRTNG
jgi:phage shock protein PspC (stress-responsive transcriptional regulator)